MAQRMAGVLAHVAAEFRRELPQRVAQVRELLDACVAAPGDDAALEALFLLLHSLAGTAGTLGMDAVGHAARRGEQAAKALRGQASRQAKDFGELQARVDDLARQRPSD